MGLAMAPIFAQGPLYDTVKVNLPYTVTVADRTLPPGEYTIRQNQSASGASPILLIYSDNGMHFETSAMTIPALDPNTARDTQVILDNVDNKYYMRKIWIQGKDYGYEFPTPRELKERSKEQVASVKVPGSYSSMAAESNANTNTMASNTTTTTTTTTTDQNQNSAAVTSSQPSTTTTDTTTMAQNTPAHVDIDQDRDRDRMNQQQAQPVNPPVATTPTYSDNNSANRDMADQQPATDNNSTSSPNRMPATSAGWLMMLLGGGSLSGVGLALRRKR